MRRLAVCAATAVLGAVVLAGCDAAPPVRFDARQVTVVGSGEVQGVPDTLSADIGIEATAPDVTAAMNQSSERQKAVIEALTARGMDLKDISTTAVSLQPQYSDNAVIAGYRASNSIRVTIRELDAASSTLSAIITAGGNATRINSVNFSIDDDSKLVSDARARAFNDAKSRARQYAELSGLSLGRVISISETAGGPPPPKPVGRGEAMAADVPLQPGRQTVSFSVTAVWELT